MTLQYAFITALDIELTFKIKNLQCSNRHDHGR